MDFVADTMSKHNKSRKHMLCCFCGLSEDNELQFGKIYKHGDIVTHYYCLLLSSNMEQKGNDNEGILGFLALDIQKELRRGKRLVCSYCKKSGATLGCCNVKCKRIFHYPCGLRAGTLNQFFGEFRSFCKYHRPKQKIDPQVKNELAKTNEVKCYICYDNVNPGDIINTIWAPCCKKNAWFHRKCVQQLAVSAGYFFKCPLCNDKKKFQKAMLEFGIFIPSQDASWELEPNAFQELLHRHDQCDAPICLCPKGRKHTSFNAKWELALCRTCGSQGIHMACGQLKWANPIWECSDCISVLGKSQETINSNTTRSTLQNDSNSEDSDSDISVGKESPVPFTLNVPIPSTASHVSTIKQRPGPRTFKVKQQLKAAKEMQIMQLNDISKRETTVKMDTTLDSMYLEESTSNKEACTIKSNLLVADKVSHDCKGHINSLTERSKPLSVASSDNVIMLDSDDDVIEVTNGTSLNNSTRIVSSVNGTETNGLSQSRNDTNEVKENDIIRNYNLLSIGKLVQSNNVNQNCDGNFLTSNFNAIESDVIKGHNSDVVKPETLEDTVHQNKETKYDCIDILSNIKITNVISLTPEEFENVEDDERTIVKEQGTNIECLKPRNKNELNNNPISQSLLLQSGSLESNLKRKFDNTSVNTTTLPEDKSKRIRKILNTHEQGQQHSFLFINVRSAESNNTSVDNVSTSTFDKNCMQINNNKNKTSTTVSNIQNGDQLHTQVAQNCITNKHTVNGYTSNTEHSVEENIYDLVSAPVISSKPKDKSNSNINYACSMRSDNEINVISENKKIEGYTRNCDGDAGTSPATKSGFRSFTNATRIDGAEEFIKLDHSHSQSNRSATSDEWRSQNDEMATIPTRRTSNAASNNVFFERKNGNTECNYPRLIPEYVRLRDLKFRVYNSNNLQMILYDKFSVNINMESTTATTTTKSTNLDASTRKVVQQKIFKAQNETLLNFVSEDILLNIPPVCNKDKGKYSLLVNEQSENYRDDAKENLDPVTTPCRSIADNLVTITTSIANNLTVSTNSNNPSEDGNSTHFVYNASKVIEEDNKWRNRESLVNAENTSDVEERVNVTSYMTTHSNEKHFRNINGVKQNIQSLSSDRVMSSITEKGSVKALCFEDHINCKTENKTRSMIGTRFKISIDLKKIENFIDNNPDLFCKCKKENDERCFEDVAFLKKRNDVAERISISNRHVTNSVINESKHLGKFTLPLPKNKVAELKSHTNEGNEKLEDIMTAENLVQGTRYINNSSINNQKRELKRTNSHFEKQCVFNR